MTGLEWRAEDIASARAAGGVDLDVYRPPGFVHAVSVRKTRCERGYVGSGIPVFVADPDPDRETVGKRP